VQHSVPKLRAGLALGAGAVALSFAAILIRLTEAPSIVIAGGRLMVASLVLMPFFWSRFPRMKRELAGRSWMLICLAGAFLAAHFALWIESLKHTSVASSVVLVAMDPIFVAVASPFILREKLSLRTGLAVALGLVGTLVIAGPSFGSALSTRGNLLALGGAACAGGYLMVGRKVRQRVELLAYIYVMYSVAAVLLVGAVYASGNTLAGLRPASYVFIVLLALGPQIVGHTSFNWALRYMSAPSVAMAILFEPVGASLLAWWILKEAPAMFEVVGGVVILAAIYLAVSEGMRAARTPERAAG
jgi:drug/metabolite transporter (DMT)-like permease